MYVTQLCHIVCNVTFQNKACCSLRLKIKFGCVPPSKSVTSENEYLLNCGIKVNSYLGVLWLGNTVIQGSADVISHLQKIGKRVFYVTNNSTKTREEFVSKCITLDYPASKVSVSLFSLILIIQASLHFNKAVIFSVLYDCISPCQYI